MTQQTPDMECVMQSDGLCAGEVLPDDGIQGPQPVCDFHWHTS